MSCKLLLLLGLVLLGCAYHGLTSLEARYTAEDRV